MNVIDLVLIVVAVSAAAHGYRNGFVSGILSLSGLLVGGLLGVLVVPLAFGNGPVTVLTATLALVMVSLAAFAGQAAARYFGIGLRDKLAKPEMRIGDAVGGAVLQTVAFLAMASVAGSVLVGARIDPISPMVQASAVLSGADAVRPSFVDSTFDAFESGTFVPRYMTPFLPEQLAEVAAPDPQVTDAAGVTDAKNAVAQVRSASDCGAVVGTGFLYAPGRVMTNAHVVDGTTETTVSLAGETLPATVVAFDAELDLAVLAVDTDVTPLNFADKANASQDAAVLGFPGGGPFDMQPARVREQKSLRSPDTTGKSTVIRDVLSLRGLIRGGNSGGPVVNVDGDVIGVVFSTSLTHDETGYALSVDQVREVAEAGRTATTEVATGACH